MEVEKKRDYRGHLMVVPYHGQGHMNPMLQFCKRLSSKGIKVTVATTVSVIKSLQQTKQVVIGDSISLEPIYDDIVEGDMKTLGGFKVFLEKFESIASKNIEKLIMKNQESPLEYPIKCLVYDANLPWCLGIAKEMSVLGAAFFTQSCSSIYSYFKMTLDDEGGKGPDSSIPDLSTIGIPVLRSFEGTSNSSGKHPPFLKFILDQLSNIKEADWVLFNTFDQLEEEVVEWMSQICPVKTIGPTIPSVYLDNRIKDDNEYGFNLFKPNEDACANWLNTKEPGTVVYISFGSAASLGPVQMEELAWGLIESKTHFLWVVRESEESKLPTNFLQEASKNGNGLIVNWCPQLQVLSHEAVGYFMTHCGWNSTIEGVCLGIPMVAMPQFLDQFSGAKFIEEVWRTGIRVKVDEKCIVRREEIGRYIKEVREGDRAQEIKKNVNRWKELAKDVVSEGGSSDSNIEEIIARLVHH
ncbi:hypothetical protein MKW92_011272 [Papaver armeniacum]|nr:hypothetical protein MKW92_011272 [Papaver armeniacum]